MRVEITGPSNEMDAASFDTQRTINLYPIIAAANNTKTPTALKKCPGTLLYRTIGGGPIRGAITTSRGRAFVVSGFEVYEVTIAGYLLLGTINTPTQRVSIAENGDQVMIVDGQDGWIFTQSTDTFAQITDTDFPTADIVVFLNGAFIVNKSGTAQFNYSSLYDGFTWGALDFKVVSAILGNIVGMTVERGDLWIWSNRLTAVYDNTGTSLIYELIDGSVVPTGCEAAFTVARADNSIVWLGVDEQGRGVVWRSDGYNAVKISTPAIDRRIAESVRRGDSFSWVYHQQGHAFYCLSVKGLDTTLIYDFATKVWHERSFRNNNTNAREQHRGACHFVFDNKNLIGDRENGNIYELSLDYHDDDGDELVVERIFPVNGNEKKLMTHSRFELDCDVGTVLGELNPLVELRYSDNNGKIYSDWLPKSMGKQGQYNTRVRWNRLGKGRDRVYHLRSSANAPIQFNAGYINGA